MNPASSETQAQGSPGKNVRAIESLRQDDKNEDPYPPTAYSPGRLVTSIFQTTSAPGPPETLAKTLQPANGQLMFLLHLSPQDIISATKLVSSRKEPFKWG